MHIIWFTHVFLFYIVVDCGILTNPANGQVTHTAGTIFGQTATYRCNTGYNLVGSSNRTCQATRVWSGSEPTCEGIAMMLSLLFCNLPNTGSHHVLYILTVMQAIINYL